MPMPRKPTPEKHCQACGKKMERRREADGDLQSLLHFGRQKYCNQVCMAKGLMGRRKAILSERRMRELAHLKVGGECERCGAKGKSLDVHHLDDNPRNNSPENLFTLCRRCHMKAHNPRWNYKA